MSKLFGSKSSEFENEALEVHNEYRREHGVPPLVLNKDISKIAQRWAEELAKKDEMSYSSNQNYGESVYCGWTADPNTKIKARDCVDKWYSEINEFSFGREPEQLKCGHFTQLVWRTTKELGVGNAKSKSGKLYVVANYYPPGNYSGKFTENVAPPGAMQFAAGSYSSSRSSNNNLPPPKSPSYKPPPPKSPHQKPPPPKSPNQKPPPRFGEIASDIVSKFKSTSVFGDKFEEECLRAHNEYRKKHGVPPLELNKKLCKYAEEWAKVIAKKGKMEHRNQNEYGENIFFAWSSDPTFTVSGKEPVDKWYSEIKFHKFGKEPTNLDSGHFSQVIWHDSKEVGVGMSRTKDGQVYVVANYTPPGNVIGSFSSKVPPPLH